MPGDAGGRSENRRRSLSGAVAPVRALRRPVGALAAIALAGAVGLAGCEERVEEPRASLSVSETMASTDTAGYARAVEPRTFTFPADHGPHPDFKHEWWYFTGNLTAGDGRDFGFQLTIFRNALRPDTALVESDWSTRQAYMGHFAVTDIAGGTFHAFERFERGALGLAGAEGGSEDPLRVWVGDWEVLGPTGEPPGTAPSEARPEFRIRAHDGGIGLSLSMEARKPIVLQGERGLSQKGPEPGNASYYYSVKRLRADGTITVGDEEIPVTGLAWLDREWSTSALSPGIAGWDWFAVQLDDGSELMLYRLREDDGGTGPFSAATWVAPSGAVSHFDADQLSLEDTGEWASPRGGTYPSGWRLRVPSLDLDLRVEPRLLDQELDLAFRYWEGAVAVSGERAGRPVRGRGYVELTGYADLPRP